MITRDFVKAFAQALKSNNGTRRPAALKPTTAIRGGGGNRPLGNGGRKPPGSGGCACSGARK